MAKKKKNDAIHAAANLGHFLACTAHISHGYAGRWRDLTTLVKEAGKVREAEYKVKVLKAASGELFDALYIVWSETRRADAKPAWLAPVGKLLREMRRRLK